MKKQKTSFDAVLTAVIANRVDGIVRQMTNTMLRSARSSVLSTARDFSCCIVTADDRLLTAADGIPPHVFGAQLQTSAVRAAHPNMREGDAFIDNDPYVGNSHAADHSILVPVFIDGIHMFTSVAKAHQVDAGNSLPTSYFASAKDVYEEGALIFPAVQIQRDFQDVDDVIRMCRKRIRVPDQWYGDYLAMVGAARVAERALKDLCRKYGAETIAQFIEDWFDYSEERVKNEIKNMPKAILTGSSQHDPMPPFQQEAIPIRAEIEVDSDEGKIIVDLRGNIDNVQNGLNLTEATTVAHTMAGVFNSFPSIPKNSGSFRRVEVLIRDGSVVGRPRFPYSASVATTNVGDRLNNCVGSAFADLGAPYGIAEGGVGMGVSGAVVSGWDRRVDGEFIGQIIMFCNGGPGSAHADGWVTYALPAVIGLQYRDSVEIDELKMPILFSHLRLASDSGAPGTMRGGLGLDIGYGPRFDPITVMYPCDGQETAPRGVLGGRDGRLAAGWLVANGQEQKLPANAEVSLSPGDLIRGVESTGGGYGQPMLRDPERVLADVREGWVSIRSAEEDYGVVIVSSIDDLRIDNKKTREARYEKAMV